MNIAANQEVPEDILVCSGEPFAKAGSSCSVVHCASSRLSSIDVERSCLKCVIVRRFKPTATESFK